MNVPFYRAFEDRHRGSRELIRERQHIYVPFLTPLKSLYPERRALDLGCGRGEWLEILVKFGFLPLGVDLDSGMLEACHELGLPVQLGDALGILKSLPDESQTVVSGFHIAEHIPFEDLKVLVSESLRVLKPAGLLILETPNAENLVVGAQNFYLDPTHERPIPHLLLGFLTEYSGFKRSKLMRMQEPPTLIGDGPVDLMSVLGGASPDYAIVAQKDAPAEQLESFDEAFDKEYGLALDILAQRYDAGVQARSARLEQQLHEYRNYSQELEVSVRDLSQRNAHTDSRMIDLQENVMQAHRVQIEELTHRLNAAMSSAERWENRALASEAQVSAFLNSSSWQITWPLRNAGKSARGVIRLPVRVVKFVTRPVLTGSIRFVMDSPFLRSRVRHVVKAYPSLFSRVKQFAIARGILEADASHTNAPMNEDNQDGVEYSSVRVSRVYAELKQAFEHKENH